MTGDALPSGDYYVLAWPEDPTRVRALLRVVDTPAGQVHEAFSWQSAWVPTDLLDRTRREATDTELVRVDVAEARSVRDALHRRNEAHGFRRPRG